MRALTGAKNPDGPADPLIVHPDVRRMLLTQKAFVEGARAFMYWLAKENDVASLGEGEAQQEAEAVVSLLTPVAKAFVTEMGLESINNGIQIFGGHGYIKEWGMEQIYRDARISTVYEGTTGIQGLDMIGRKVLGSGGEMLKKYTKLIHKFCEANSDNAELSALVVALKAKNKEWGELTMHVGGKAMENPDEVGAAAVDYIMYSGYISFAFMWLQMAKVAQEKLASGEGDADFYKAKIQTAQFYFDRLLPRTDALACMMKSGSDNLMAMDAEHFIFS
jgi:hypothetical protein